MTKLVWAFVLCCVTAPNALAANVEEVLKRYMAAWDVHDIQQISEFYAPDVIWYDLPSDTTTKGKDRVTKAITDAFMSYVPNMFWVKSGDTFVTRDTVIYEWIYGGTFTGTWGKAMVKGKDFSIKGLSSTTINKDGKIVSQKDYYDLDSFKRALGLVE